MKSEQPPRLLALSLFSFGFKYGAPADVNFLFDVRFLPNPYWVEELRPKTGLDPVIASFVAGSPAGRALLERLWPLLAFVVEQSGLAGKEMMRIAVGCTGGRHRSVATVEALARLLRDLPVELEVHHRDINRDEVAPFFQG